MTPVPGLAQTEPRRWQLTRTRARMAPESSREIRLQGGRIEQHPATGAHPLAAGAKLLSKG